MIFDTHAHYDDEQFDTDRDQLLASMEAGGVGTIVNVGASLASSRTSVSLAERYSFIYAAVGVHPDHTGELDEDKLRELRELCGQEKDLTSYIVSAIASSEPLLTARQKGIQAAEDYMEEVTGEARREDRRQILHTTAEDLEKVSYILDEICEKGGSCIVGSQEALDAAGDALSCRRSL